MSLLEMHEPTAIPLARQDRQQPEIENGGSDV